MKKSPIETASKEEKTGSVPSAEQIRRRKMMIAIPIMLIPFCLCLYWIFFSGSSQQESGGAKGINVEIPEPKTVTLADDKRKAYEQEQLQNMKSDKMHSLQDYLADLKSNRQKTEGSISDSLPEAVTQSEPAPLSAIDHSAKAYKNTASQINAFYQPVKTDKTDDLEKQVAELKNRLGEQKEAKTDQLEMMEKSYQLAAKYLMPKEEAPVEEEKYSVPVSKIREQTVSSLSGSQTQYGFYTAVGESYERSLPYINTIKACVHENQKITNGSRVKLRLLEEIKAASTYIPKNSIIYGTAQVQGERLEIIIPNIEYNGSIIPVELLVYDTDGQAGIFIPGSMEISAGKEALGSMGQSLGSSVSIAQDVKQQLVMDATKIGINGVSQFLGKKFREVNINLKAGYQILLAPKKLNP